MHRDSFTAFYVLAYSQVFIDYNISGMSYVHLKNALFLLPLPESSSIPASQLPDIDKGADSSSRACPGFFVASTVSDSLVAYPPRGRPAAARDAYRKPDRREYSAYTSGSEQEPMDEVCACTGFVCSSNAINRQLFYIICGPMCILALLIVHFFALASPFS